MTIDIPDSGLDIAALRRKVLERRLAGRAGTTPATEGIARLPRTEPRALSFAQQRLWMLDQLRPGQDEYLIPVAVELIGPVDEAALDSALAGLVARHEVLRTRYVLRDNEPAQVIDEPPPVRIDRSACREEDLQSVIAKLSRVPVNLRREHPIRFHLVELGPERQVLLICIHHIAFDGWSTGVLLRELSELYSAAVERRPPVLAEVPTQYVDYAAWERTRLRGTVGDGQIEYWRRQLAGLDDLALLTDRPHPAEWDTRGAAEQFVIPADMADTMRSLGRRAGTTPFVTVLAAVQAFLSRYCLQHDIAVGVPSAGRPRADLSDTIGYFGNMLVMRADLAAEPTFTDLLQQARATSMAAYANQDVPFDWLVTELRSHRDLARNPIFQASLTVGEGPEDEGLALTGLTSRTLDIDWIPAKFDLSFYVEVSPAGDWTGSLIYPTALFDRATISSMARNFVAFISAVTAEPDRPVTQIGFATGDEVVAVETTHIPVTATVHEAVERAAATAGERVALRFGDERLSYRDLNERANRLARHLLATGVNRGSLVGVRLGRGPDLVIALLAVLKAGAAYLPLDPDQPDERVNYMIDDSAATLVVTEERFAAGLDARLVVIDDGATRAEVAGLAGNDLGRPTSPDDLAYVMYTSGSTGRPKGVMVTHRNVMRLFHAIDRDLITGPDDVWTAFHSYAFDFSVWEIWGALVHGSRLVLVSFETSRSPEDLLRLLGDEQVTVLSQTPSAFAGLTRALDDRGSLDGLTLRAVVFGGEALDPAQLRPWFRLGGSRTPRMINMYGITETTVHVTYRELGMADCPERAGVNRSPIGRPLADLSLYVLGPAGQPVPVGVPGEIYVGGAGVARGYLGRAALTADRFVPDPFGTEPGARLYRTGDLARQNPDGQIEYLGRADQQIKIRGHRIELGEIEAVLASHPLVTTAVVNVHWTGPGDGRIFGYLVLAGDVTPEEVRQYAAGRLPAYMLPASVVAIPRIPLTVNGKLDRGQLPQPRLESTVPYVAPRTPTELLIAEVLSEVLDGVRVGVHDNFFQLGGDSIRAVRAVGMLRARSFPVAVADLFRRQTVTEIAELAGGTMEMDELTPPFALISPTDRDRLPEGIADAYPLAQTQAGMLFELLLSEHAHPYHNVTIYPVRERGNFAMEALQKAGRHLIARHDILRTSIDVTSFSEPLQLVHREATLDIRYTDLRLLPAEQRNARLWEIVATERTELFDIGAAPLWRLHVVQFTDESWDLCLVEFHAILDGWSHNSTVTELLRTYEAFRDDTGTPTLGRPGAVRFADFIALEQASIRSASDRDFWEQRVTGAWDRIALPELWAGPSGALTYEVNIPLEKSESGLRELARIAAVPYKTVLLAAYLRVLGIATGQERFFAGLVSNGRPESLGGDDVRGMHLNTVPFAAPALPDTWVRYVRDVFAEEIAVHAHRRYPLPVMQANWGGDTPLIETAFNFINFYVLDRELVDVDALHDVSPNEFAMTLSTGDHGLSLTARPERIAPEYGEMIGRLFTQVLAAMAGAPHGDPRRAPIDPADRRLAFALAAGPVEPVGETFMDLIDRWADERPDEPAVHDPAGDLTYAELRRRSGQVAAGLRARGAGPERVVGIGLRRGRDFVVTMLGILRAGSAFMVVDPTQPATRRATLLHEAGVFLLIGHDGTDLGVPVLSPDSFAGLSPITDPVRVSPQTLAYLVSTSGSTGRPKSVMLTHRGLVNSVGPYLGLLDIGPGDRIAQLAPVVFDMAVLEIVVGLTRGATVCIPDPDVLAVGDILSGLLTRMAVTHIIIVPSALDVLDPDSAPTLRVVAAGGEACWTQLAERWTGRVRFLNVYGPTEYTMLSTGTEISPGRERSLTIGHAIDNTMAYVLDSQLDPVPVGVPGELCVAGLSIGRGYAGRPDLTADRFLPDEFSGVPGARLYRTGDRVIRRQDGELVFVGRLDHQVKVNGHRIELGETESVLQDHPEVRQAAVVVRGENERRHLVAFVTTTGSSLTPGDLKRYLRERLATYLVPARIALMDELPRTATGKIDRKALTSLPLDDDHRTESVAPRTELEARVAAVWQRVLRIDRAGVHDDFFHMGGHSLLAVRLAAQLSEALGSSVSVANVVQRRTIAEIAAAVAAGGTGSTGGPLHWLRGTGSEVPLLCVHPGGGDIHWYDRLAEILPKEQPVGAFRFPGAEFPGAGSAAELARHYLDQLDSSLTGDGVRLLGWCGGSPIAWEIARLLTESDVPVRLTLVDPLGSHTDASDDLRSFQRIEDLLTRLVAGDDSIRAEAFAMLAATLGEELPEEDLTDEAWLHRVRGWRSLLQALFSYEFRPAHWPVDLIFGDEIAAGTHSVLQGTRPEDYLQSWRDLVTGVPNSWTTVPGSHLGVLDEPHVTRLAETLTARWSAAEQLRESS